ncbi:MAG: carotenoid oxygenase family protein, partial [Acidimicrobiia bacterium]
PYVSNLMTLVPGLRSIADTFSWQPDRGLEIIVASRNGGTPRSFRTESTFIIHTANAYEDSDELVLDVVGYSDASVMQFLKDVLSKETHVLNARPNPAIRGYLRRYWLNYVTGVIRQTELNDVPCEFPRIDPRRVGQVYRYVYA